jgi:hypothetical protein
MLVVDPLEIVRVSVELVLVVDMLEFLMVLQ